MKYTAKQFNEKFTDNDACLAYVFELRYGDMKACPKCGVAEPKYYRVRSKKVFECKDCGNQISPLAHTIFHKSETSLRSWFFAIFMFSVSKNGVSAKELERALGVTYKCAWRIAKLIRSLMSQGNYTLKGIIEADETYVGGVHKGMNITVQDKAPVFGMVERGGRVKATQVKSTGSRVLLPEIVKGVAIGTQINTDEWGAYRKLPKLGYSHTTVNHKTLEFARGSVHTNTIEGFWSQLKRSIDGTYHSVSPKYLQLYVDEFVFRYNLRNDPVFPALIAKAGKRVS